MERTIEATTTVPAALARSREVLLDDPGAVLAEMSSAADRRARAFHTQLSVDVGAGGTVHHEVLVELGAPRDVAGALVLPIRWEPSGHTHLLPQFTGELVASSDREGTRLTMRGSYTVPLGALGRFGDGIAGHRIARRSLEDFIAVTARRLDLEVDRRIVLGHARPRDGFTKTPPARSEHYIG